MKVKRTKMKFRLLILLLVAALFATSANAAFVQFAGFNDTFAFTGMGIIAEVHCVVYKDDVSGEYKYTYEITNNSDVAISSFLVGIFDGANVTSIGYDSGGIAPEYWDTVGSPDVEGVSAEFDFLANGDTSSLLWFTSDFAPVEAENGALLGYDSGFPKFASGYVYTPMPEPATIALLGMGGLVTLVRKKRFA